MLDTADVSDGMIFLPGHQWADMGTWHDEAARLRREHPVLLVEADVFSPFWAVTRHSDVLAISRDNERWLNTSRAVLGPDEDWEHLLASGMPIPKSLVHLDGSEH